jgi:hypothetical protein
MLIILVTQKEHNKIFKWKISIKLKVFRNCYFVKTKRPRPVLQRTHIAENQQQQAKVSSSVDEKRQSFLVLLGICEIRH